MEPGSKLETFIHATEMPAASVELPLVIISGSKKGKTLAVTAGVHGSEYCAIVAAHRLARQLDSTSMSGTLAIVPLVNRAAFEARARAVNPVDNVNQNRAFPGRNDGSVSYQIAHALFNELILKSDAYIDLHGGDLMESLIPYAVFSRTGISDVDVPSEGMAKAFGVKYLWRTPSARAAGGDSTEGGPWAPRGVAFAEAASAGVPAMLGEAGEDGKLEEKNVQTLYDGVINVMRYLGILEGHPNGGHNPIVSERCIFIGARRGGIFFSRKKAGDMVGTGEVMGEIRSLKGDILEEVKAPFKGVLLAVVNNPAVKISDDIYELLEI